MSQSGNDGPPPGQARGTDGGREKTQTREERLAAQLRANLQRRKAQARARRDTDGGGSEDDEKGGETGR